MQTKYRKVNMCDEQKLYNNNYITKGQLNEVKKQLSKRELSQILFDTLKKENGLAIRMIVRDYNNKQMENKNVKQIRNMATNSTI